MTRTIMKSSCALFVTFLATFAGAEEKWIWSKEHKTDVVQSDTTKISIAKPILNDLETDSSRRKIDDDTSRFFSDDDDYRKARYEVQELVDGSTSRPYVHIRPRPYPQRPISPPPPPLPDRPLPFYPDRPGNPFVDGPGNSFPNGPGTSFPYRPVTAFPSRPIGPTPDGPNGYNPLFAGNEENPIRRQPPPAQSVGILTGPIPSWEKPSLHKNGDPTNFEHCKCSFSFNCKSPGIQFGSCDQGKTYCCYNEFLSTKDGVPAATNNGFGTANVDRFDGEPSVRGPSRPNFVDHRDVKPLLPSPSRGHGHRPNVRPNYEDVDKGLDYLENRSQRPLIPQKPILPPYMGLHNDYRSS